MRNVEARKADDKAKIGGGRYRGRSQVITWAVLLYFDVAAADDDDRESTTSRSGGVEHGLLSDV